MISVHFRSDGKQRKTMLNANIMTSMKRHPSCLLIPNVFGLQWLYSDREMFDDCIIVKCIVVNVSIETVSSQIHILISTFEITLSFLPLFPFYAISWSSYKSYDHFVVHSILDTLSHFGYCLTVCGSVCQWLNGGIGCCGWPRDIVCCVCSWHCSSVASCLHHSSHAAWLLADPLYSRMKLVSSIRLRDSVASRPQYLAVQLYLASKWSDWLTSFTALILLFWLASVVSHSVLCGWLYLLCGWLLPLTWPHSHLYGPHLFISFCCDLCILISVL